MSMDIETLEKGLCHIIKGMIIITSKLDKTNNVTNNDIKKFVSEMISNKRE